LVDMVNSDWRWLKRPSWLVLDPSTKEY
jgi:hypothetical protein